MLLNAILTVLLGEALELLLSPLPSPASFLFYLEPNVLWNKRQNWCSQERRQLKNLFTKLLSLKLCKPDRY